MKNKKPKEGVVLDTSIEQPMEDNKFNPHVHIRSDLWGTLSINDLWLQHSLMQRRLNGARAIQNGPMEQAIQRGIDQLLLVIEEKSADIKDDNLIF